MKNLRRRIVKFFFPPSGSPRWVRVLPYSILGVLTLILLTAAAYGWEYTNSPEFCGTTCHTMPPEYTSYLISPHARIACVDCHIGKGFIATRISRKAGDLKHVFAVTFKTYEFPIRADDLRPARETCELCHFPDKFSDDSLREIKRFANDPNNTPMSIYLTLKTGGGNQRQGLGRGIHWHIQNKIYYYATDPESQIIPYVRVIGENGDITEYIDVEANFDRSMVREENLAEMDCITCHNRITHVVLPPEDTVDQLLARNLISSEIPEIRLKAIEVYQQLFDTTERGLINISGLESYYQKYYPEFYASNSQLVRDAIAVLQEVYSASVFPHQNSNWTTHPNNIGHKDSPGCFRCHDGKHLDAQQQAIRLECNICHSVPVVAGPEDFVSHIEISRGPEPETHKNQNWISLHNQIFDSTCTNCHTTNDAGGTSNTSFCSNSACHGSAWTYAGFDAPKLRTILQAQLPPPATLEIPVGLGKMTYEGSVGAILKARCGSCHGEGGVQGLNVTTYLSLMAGGKSGPVIITGNPTGSLIVKKISGSQPHFAQLTAAELELLIQWIEAGAVEK